MKKRKRKSLRKTDRDFRARGVPVDWEANHARSRRLEKIVDSSRLERRDIARHLGISGEHLSRLLRVKTIHLGPRMEGKIEQAVRSLMRRTLIEVKRCMRMKVVESKKDTARAERIDRIIRKSRVKRGDIARQAGISLSHLSSVLRAKRTHLGPKMEKRIEQTIDDLQRDRYFATYRSLHSQAESDGNDDRADDLSGMRKAVLAGDDAPAKEDTAAGVLTFSGHSLGVSPIPLILALRGSGCRFYPFGIPKVPLVASGASEAFQPFFSNRYVTKFSWIRRARRWSFDLGPGRVRGTFRGPR